MLFVGNWGQGFFYEPHNFYGNTAHENRNEAITETEKFPVFQEQKKYCIKAMMQSGKSLKVGTSHFLVQNFSKAFDVKFTDNLY